MKRLPHASQEGYLKENYHYFHLRDSAGQERDFHFHSFDKLVILLSGRVDYAVEDASYALRPWDILLVKHHTIHKALIDKSRPYERVILYLDRSYFDRLLPGTAFSGCFDRAERSGQYVLVPDAEQRQGLAALLSAFEGCREDEEFGAQALRDTYILQLLILLNRLSAARADATAEKTVDSKIAAVLSYINEHLTETLDVDTLAERAYLSRYHFMRLFKAQTGSTVHAYVRQKRLLNAARMIREGVPAARASAESGFADYSAFHRAFTESFGVSPGKLKQ